MEDKRGSLMFDMALKVKVNFKDMPSIEMLVRLLSTVRRSARVAGSAGSPFCQLADSCNNSR